LDTYVLTGESNTYSNAGESHMLSRELRYIKIDPEYYTNLWQFTYMPVI
jgi:hypothetical protein